MIEFLGNRRYATRLNCNRGMGSWTQGDRSAAGGSLSLGQAAMTRAMCPAGSLDTKIAADLGRIRSFTIRDNMLNLALEADGGIYS